MKELIIMLILFSILLVVQLNEQKDIIIQSYKSKFHFIMYISLFLAILVLFRQTNLIDQSKLLIFAGLVLNFGIQKEGLTKDKFIKAGYVFSANYTKSKIIEIDSFFKNKTEVNLKKSKNDRGITLILKESPTNIKDFFEDVSDNFAIEMKE